MTTSQALVAPEQMIANASKADEISEAVAEVERLLVADPEAAKDALTDARAKAEATALWARRTKHDDEARHFGKLRLITEAGLGVLALDGVPLSECPAKWKTLAAAFERGQLLACAESEVTASAVASEIRRRGLTFVPRSALPRGYESWQSPSSTSWPWATARLICRERGIEPNSLPPDPRPIERARAARAEAAERRTADATAHRERQHRLTTARLLKQVDPKLDEVYGYIRKALDALQVVDAFAIEELKPYRDEAFAGLYRAEDAIRHAGHAAKREAA